MRRSWRILVLVLLCSGWASTAQAQVYYLYVAAEAQNEINVVRFDSRTNTATVGERITVGAAEVGGPYGLAVDPNGAYWYVVLTEGSSSGKAVKYTTDTNQRVGEVDVGPSVAAMWLSAATGQLYVVNRGAGDEPGTLSTVDPATMTVSTRTSTAFQPLGLSPAGRTLYAVALMDSLFYEIDTATFNVTRQLDLTSGPPAASNIAAHMDSTEHDRPAPMRHEAPVLKLSGLTTHPTRPFVYIANRGTNTIVEIDTRTWRVTRRFATKGAPYGLAVSPSPDGLHYLIATQQASGSTGFFNLERGEEVVRVQNSRRGPHSVVASPDGRYAFVSLQGDNEAPGAVDVITLDTAERIASVDVGRGAGRIAFWKIADE